MLEELALAGRTFPAQSLGRAASELRRSGIELEADGELAVRHGLFAEAAIARLSEAECRLGRFPPAQPADVPVAVRRSAAACRLGRRRTFPAHDARARRRDRFRAVGQPRTALAATGEAIHLGGNRRAGRGAASQDDQPRTGSPGAGRTRARHPRDRGADGSRARHGEPDLAAATRKIGAVSRVQPAAILPALADRVHDDLRRLGREGVAARPELGSDEQHLLARIAEGMSLGEAAESLHVSRRTADRRIDSARRALGVATTAEAIVAFQRRGWRPPEGTREWPAAAARRARAGIRAWIMAMRWHDLLFAHWRVAEDTCDGWCRSRLRSRRSTARPSSASCRSAAGSVPA